MAVDYTPSFDPADVDSDYGSTGGDITVPTFTANMKPFRFWCQHALPLVYDDSLSYYEVLCKVVNQLNGFLTDLQTATGSIGEFAQQFVINQTFLNNMAAKLGQDVDALETYINDRMDDFTTAYQQLQSYVNNYFDNLDVQQEINTKLDEMAQDGTFNTLFNPVITAWMTEKTAQIDEDLADQNETLAEQNSRISVLESRMDTFASLPSGSTSGNAELLDIRTNFLGETYASAGDAVRASDMIASGFQSIGFTRLTDWNGNEESSVYDTIVIDVAAYKGGHVVVIANMDQFVLAIENGTGIGLYGSNVAGKTVDANATPYPFPDGFSGISNPVFKNYSIITTSIQREERVLLQLSIPNDFAFQYLKLGNVEKSESGEHTTPLAIVYATSWSKTPVDATLSIAGAAADAKATGDGLSSLNERIVNLKEELDDELSSGNVTLETLTEIIPNEYVTSQGAIDEYNGWDRTDYIPVKGIISISLEGANLRQNAFFDANKNYISNSFFSLLAGVSKAVPSNAEYVIFSDLSERIAAAKYFLTKPSFADSVSQKIAELGTGLLSSSCPNAIYLCRDAMVRNNVPPNSAYAIAETAKNQYDKVRFSVTKTADGQYVAIHDSTINNLAVNPDGTTISTPLDPFEMTVAELNQYDWGLKFGEEYRGLTVPMLDDCIKYASMYGLTIALDFKWVSTFSQTDVDNISAMLAKYGQLDAVLMVLTVENMQRFQAKSKKLSFEFAGTLEQLQSQSTVLASLLSGYNKIYIQYRPVGTAPTTEFIALATANNFDLMFTTIDGIDDLTTLGFGNGITLYECHYIENIKSTIRAYADSLI